MADEHISSEDLSLIKQLRDNVINASRECDLADHVLQKAHAEKRAAEAELRAAEAEYQGTIMKLLWQYELPRGSSFRQSDGLIMRGENNGKTTSDGKEKNELDPSSKSEEDKGNG